MTEWIMLVGEFGSYNRFSGYFFVNCIDWLRTQTSPQSSRSQICCMCIGHAVWYINNNLHILLCALNSERLNFEFSWLALHALRYWYDLMRGKINWNSTRVILWGNFGEGHVSSYQATTLFKIMRPAYIVKAAGFNYDHHNKKRPALVCWSSPCVTVLNLRR